MDYISFQGKWLPDEEKASHPNQENIVVGWRYFCAPEIFPLTSKRQPLPDRPRQPKIFWNIPNLRNNIYFVSTMAEDYIETIRKQCQQHTNDAKVYRKVFQIRAGRLSMVVGFIKFTGLIVPLSLGAITISFGFKYSGYEKVVLWAAVLTLIQFLLSVSVDIFGWGDKLAYYREAAKDLDYLANDFNQLAIKGHTDGGIYNHMFEMLRAKYQARRAMNLNYDVGKNELRNAERQLAYEY